MQLHFPFLSFSLLFLSGIKYKRFFHPYWIFVSDNAEAINLETNHADMGSIRLQIPVYITIVMPC